MLLLVIFLLPFTAPAGVGDWTTFTNQNDIRDMILVDQHLWCATNGGVFRYGTTDSSYVQLYNTNGLSSLDARAIEEDQHGNIWVGFADGWLNYRDGTTQTLTAINDYLGYAIFDLHATGDSLLVALDIGVSLYDIKRREVKETYKNLGRQIPVETPVSQIYIHGRDIWAATEQGIAYSSFDLANLMAPESWTNYSITQGMPSNIIRAIVSHNDTVFVATNNGIAVYDGQSWRTVNQGLNSLDVLALRIQSGQIYALNSHYIYRWNGTALRWDYATPFIGGLNCFVVTTENNFWVGRKKSAAAQGFVFYTPATQQVREFVAPGPPGNEIACLAVDHNGVLWCGSMNDGIFFFDEKTAQQNWHQLTRQDGLSTNRIESVAIDNQNRKWFGTVGGGVALIDDSENQLSISLFYKPELSGISTDPNYVLITDIGIDRFNNSWILNMSAANNNVIAVYSSLREWQYFALQQGILSQYVRAIDFDQYDRVWIGSDGGVNVIDYNNTLMDKSDDDYSGTLTTIDGLESNKVKDLAIDLDNIAWIGTELGLNYWNQGNLYYQGGLLSNTVNKIEVDVRNNKWFGTTAGVSVLEPDGVTLIHYNTDNSPIVSDNVTAFGFDQETGRVYIGTTKGLSCLHTPYSRPREDLTQVKAGPNPFILSRDSYFAISNLSDDVSIKFLTENGMVVRHISKEEILGSQAIWDGRNDAGHPVASGVYLFVIYSHEVGMNRTGKVAVIY
ncbi:MAG: hypothetical protein SCK70_08695 [bacterium]|nr:hypothetical protein [bacterium]